jgi:hypothetical protein
VPAELMGAIIDKLGIFDEAFAHRIGRLVLAAMTAQHAIDVRNHENEFLGDYSDCA